MTGQTNATLNLANLQLTNGGLYTIIVSNQFGAVTNSATEVIAAAPAIQPGTGGGSPASGQPQSTTVVKGQTATFSVNAIGSAPLTYQWRFGGVNLAGATNNVLTLTNVQAAQAGLYSVVISNPFGNTTSSNATLTVLLPPTIVVQPVSQTLTNGATLILSVTATGSPTLTYQWSLHGTPIPGATAATLTLFNVQESLEGNYVCVVTNPYGTATSQVAVVTVQSPPSIFDLGQPAPQTVIRGSNATFTVSATGDVPFTYQWRFNGTNIVGATNNPLVLLGVQTNQAGNYSVVVSNPFGSATSSNALLTVRVPPFIITQPTPTNQIIIAGTNTTIIVLAGGDPTLAYQWRLNGTNISGATNATLTLAAVQTNQLGLYSVVVSNPYGSVTSSNATLDVKTAPFIVSQPQSGQPQSLTVLQGSPAAFSVTAGGMTWNWGYNNNAQFTAADPAAPFLGAPSLAFHSVSSLADGQARGSRDKMILGFELAYEEVLGRWHITEKRRANIGILATLGYLRLGQRDSGALAGTVGLTTDKYATGAVLPPLAPYSGSFGTAGPLIPDVPANRAAAVVSATGTVNNKLEGSLYGFNIGPFIELPLHDRVSLTLGGGLGCVYADTAYTYSETVVVPGVVTAARTGRVSRDAWLFSGIARRTSTWR